MPAHPNHDTTLHAAISYAQSERAATVIDTLAIGCKAQRELNHEPPLQPFAYCPGNTPIARQLYDLLDYAATNGIDLGTLFNEEVARRDRREPYTHRGHARS
jgi:hypothetical protein